VDFEVATEIFKQVCELTGEGYGKLETKIANACHRYDKNYRERHGQVKVFCVGMRKPIPLDDVYVGVQFLDQHTASRYKSPEEIEQAFRERRRWHFDSTSDERKDGTQVANDEQYLMLLGGPGVEKSTFLRKVGLEALKAKQGGFAHKCIPVFLELKRFTEVQIDIETLINREFEICGYPHPELMTDVKNKSETTKRRFIKFMIKSLKLESYRGFSDTTIEFSNITCIVGENSTGKSTIIQAIQDLLTSDSAIPENHCKVGINDNNTTSLLLALQNGMELSKNIQNVQYEGVKSLPECIRDINPISVNYSFPLTNNSLYNQPIKNQNITDIAWRNILSQCDVTLKTAQASILSSSSSSAKRFNKQHTLGISEKFTNTFNDMLKNSNRQYEFEVFFERSGDRLNAQLLISYRVNNKESNEGSSEVDLNYESEGFRTLIALCSYFFNDQDQSEKIFVMDEPFKNIHPKAQMEVSRMLQSLSQRFQIIYTTHCPHLLPELNKVICTVTENAGDLSISKYEKDSYNLFYELSPLALDTVEEIKRSDSAINVFVEGKTDEKIYEKFFELEEISDMIDITNVKGVGNIQTFIKALAGINKPSLFIVDPGEYPKQLKGCRQDIEKYDNLFLLELPYEENNHIKKGIENLMPNHIIQKAFQKKIGKIEKLTRETYEETPVVEYETNNKKELAEFFVNEAKEDDYKFFRPVIDNIKQIQNSLCGN